MNNYDAARYAKLKAEGICVSCKKEPAEAGYVCCPSCRDKQRKRSKERREWYKLNGICPECGSEKLIGEETKCLICRAKKYGANLKRGYRYDRDYYKSRREQRLNDGLCTQCGRRAESGKTMCRICLNKKLVYRRDRMTDIPRNERMAYGRCYNCGTDIDSGKLCEKCRQSRISNLPQFSENWHRYHKQMNQTLFGN